MAELSSILTAAAVTVFATLAVHLGLLQAVSRVASKIAKCNMCASFWLNVFVLMMTGVNMLYVPLLSVLSAYASNWLVLALIKLQSLYDKLWKRLNKTENER